MKIFRIVTLISTILTLTVAFASVMGVAITGFYPGIIVLLLLTLIPIASNFCAKKIISKSTVFQKKYYTTLAIINLFTILVVLWMTFVILVDRVFGNILVN
jgi:ABC-type microcin C transport system permease subunit YejE